MSDQERSRLTNEHGYGQRQQTITSTRYCAKPQIRETSQLRSADETVDSSKTSSGSNCFRLVAALHDASQPEVGDFQQSSGHSLDRDLPIDPRRQVGSLAG